MSSPSSRIVERAFTAFAGHDREQIAAVLTEDAEWLSYPDNPSVAVLGGTHHMVGREAVVAFFAEDFPRLYTRDVGVTVHAIHADGDRVVTELTMTATLADGRPYTNDFCFVFELRDGLIHRAREYVDTARGLRMVEGVVPAEGTPGAAPGAGAGGTG